MPISKTYPLKKSVAMPIAYSGMSISPTAQEIIQLNHGVSIITESLFEKIGGEKTMAAAVEIFYCKVLSDYTICHFFDDTNMERQRLKQRAFLTMVCGGQVNYSGRNLRIAHAPMVARGLSEKHFVAVARHLKDALQELGVTEDLTDQVMTIVASYHDDVLNL